MTNDAIDRAIKRGTGDTEGVHYESVMYEGYAPGGVAILVDVLTDNRNRTGAEVRNVFSKMGGSMAEPGSVSWQFSRRGIVLVPATVPEDDVMLAALDAGADDVAAEGDTWRILCEPSLTEQVRLGLEEAGIEVASAETTLLSSNIVPVDTAEDAKKVLRILDALEDNDDVQDVYSNFDIPDDIMATVEA
jgi:YebC/PmpR family DNA-binding regulatory protein